MVVACSLDTTINSAPAWKNAITSSSAHYAPTIGLGGIFAEFTSPKAKWKKSDHKGWKIGGGDDDQGVYVKWARQAFVTTSVNFDAFGHGQHACASSLFA